jgi:uncharacterized protein (TIGR03083 family)
LATEQSSLNDARSNAWRDVRITATEGLAPGTPATIYCDVRERFIALVTSLSPEQLELWVPACPQWSVHEVIAHLVEAAADFVAGNLPGPDVPFECWTAVQVAKRRGQPLDALIEEWEGTAAELASRLAGGKAPEGPLINGLATHEQDVRGPLGSREAVTPVATPLR